MHWNKKVHSEAGMTTRGKHVPAGTRLLRGHRTRALSAAAVCVALVAAAFAVVGRHADAAGPGGLQPGWVAHTGMSINGPSDGVDALTMSMSIEDAQGPGNQWFFSNKFFFQGNANSNSNRLGYIGLTPNATQLSHDSRPHSLFRVFGTGTHPVTTPCAAGADRLPGTSCDLPFNWQVGHTYHLTVAVIPRSTAIERLTATAVDDQTGQRFDAGAIDVPASWGRLFPGVEGFAEYPAAVASCDKLPQGSARFDTPVGHRDGRDYPGRVNYAEKTTFPAGNPAAEAAIAQRYPTNPPFGDCTGVSHVSTEGSSVRLQAPTDWFGSYVASTVDTIKKQGLG